MCPLALAVSQCKCNGQVNLPGDPVVDKSGHFRAFTRRVRGGQRVLSSVVARAWYCSVLGQCTSSQRMHAGPLAFTCARPHIPVRNCQTQGRTRSGVLTPAPKGACPLSHHSRVPVYPVYAALELTMTHAVDTSWHVACQCAGAASSACCVGKCTGACIKRPSHNAERGCYCWWTWGV
jgi:hypothetical protein